ncbi:MAG: acetyl-CoA carboxylase biotin carboxyl carrier protein [Muribaculum sp.]|nr:acetyl-CoA carboxylase biotin carboxyl carrier protein [Muribaculum sp.]
MEAGMEYEQIIGLIDHVAASGLSAFTYEAEGLKLSMKGRQPAGSAAGTSPLSQERASGQQTSQEGPFAPAGQQELQYGAGLDGAQGKDAVAADGRIVASPLVGTFYRAPAEDAEPFVNVGDSVKKGQVLAIVEAMKLMNEIESDFDGVVTKILVQDGEPVEYGQPLFCVE